MSRNVGLAMRLAACRTGLLLVAALCATPGYADSLDQLYQLAKQDKDSGHVGSGAERWL